MKRTTVEQAMVFAALVAACAGLRWYFQHIPNFAPVAAVALFAGYLLPSRRMAVMVPVCALLVTDWFIGGYQPVLMVTVYTLLAMPILMRDWIRRHFQMSGSASSVAASVVGLLACTLTASVLFFAVTNLMVWVVTPWYARSLAGLGQCYANAIPFFRYTLAGDVTFATVLFGGHAAWQCLGGRHTNPMRQSVRPSTVLLAGRTANELTGS